MTIRKPAGGAVCALLTLGIVFAGALFAAEQTVEATIVLDNGMVILGKIGLDTLTVETPYGPLSLPADAISAISFEAREAGRQAIEPVAEPGSDIPVPALGQSGELLINAADAAVDGILEQEIRTYLVAAKDRTEGDEPALIRFSVPADGIYEIAVFARPAGDKVGDSFYAALDDGETFKVSLPSTEWSWVDMRLTEERKMALNAGEHVIQIFPREKGAMIEKIRILAEGKAPTVEAPKDEKPEAPAAEAPKDEKPEAPAAETPKAEKPEAPAVEAPKGKALKKGGKGKAPKEAPKEEPAKEPAEAPVAEKPAAE